MYIYIYIYIYIYMCIYSGVRRMDMYGRLVRAGGAPIGHHSINKREWIVIYND